jgi:hypothetical protein
VNPVGDSLKLPGDIVVSASSRPQPCFGTASRTCSTYSMGWQSAMVSSGTLGACTRNRDWNRSCSRTLSIARSRSGRSG